MTHPWTIEDVAARFEEAAHTARRLPPVRVQGYFNLWPPIVRSRWEVLASEDRDDTHFPPTPEAVERMMEVSRWVQWLTPEERRLVWMRAKGIGWRTIAIHFACDRSTAWRHWKKCIANVTQQLNNPDLR